MIAFVGALLLLLVAHAPSDGFPRRSDLSPM